MPPCEIFSGQIPNSRLSSKPPPFLGGIPPPPPRPSHFWRCVCPNPTTLYPPRCTPATSPPPPFLFPQFLLLQPFSTPPSSDPYPFPRNALPLILGPPRAPDFAFVAVGARDEPAASFHLGFFSNLLYSEAPHPCPITTLSLISTVWVTAGAAYNTCGFVDTGLLPPSPFLLDDANLFLLFVLRAESYTLHEAALLYGCALVTQPQAGGRPLGTVLLPIALVDRRR